MEECIFDYIALHIECQFNKTHSSGVTFLAFSAGWDTLREEILAGRKFGGFGGFGKNPPN